MVVKSVHDNELVEKSFKSAIYILHHTRPISERKFRKPFYTALKPNLSFNQLLKKGEKIPIKMSKLIFDIVAEGDLPKDEFEEYIKLMEESIDKIKLPQNLQNSFFLEDEDLPSNLKDYLKFGFHYNAKAAEEERYERKLEMLKFIIRKTQEYLHVYYQ